jgi:hypothetical protein
MVGGILSSGARAKEAKKAGENPRPSLWAVQDLNL